MIIESIFDFFGSFILLIINLLPDLSVVTIPLDVSRWLIDCLNTCSYFFPVGDFILMLVIFLATVNWHLTWKIFQRIWDALPFT